MDIILKVLTMYGIAFCIAMLVAAVIWVLYKAATTDLLNKIISRLKSEKSQK
jgi:hypothetical protein